MISKIPKDLGIKVGTPEEAIWRKVKTEAMILIEQHEQSLIVQKALLILAVKKIAEKEKEFKEINTKLK